MKRGIHEVIPPSSEEQILFREQREKELRNIKKPHCLICGDTENLVRCKGTDNKIYCIYQDCYDIQSKMLPCNTIEGNMKRVFEC